MVNAIGTEWGHMRAVVFSVFASSRLFEGWPLRREEPTHRGQSRCSTRSRLHRRPSSKVSGWVVLVVTRRTATFTTFDPASERRRTVQPDEFDVAAFEYSLAAGYGPRAKKLARLKGPLVAIWRVD